jgi:hypothetical protein
MASPAPPTTSVGKPVKFEDDVIGTVEDDVSLLVGDDDYVQFLQRIRLNEKKAAELESTYAYRWCYYSLSGPENKKRPNQWVFGQYAQLLSETHLQDILAMARSKGWSI